MKYALELRAPLSLLEQREGRLLRRMREMTELTEMLGEEVNTSASIVGGCATLLGQAEAENVPREQTRELVDMLQARKKQAETRQRNRAQAKLVNTTLPSETTRRPSPP